MFSEVRPQMLGILAAFLIIFWGLRLLDVVHFHDAVAILFSDGSGQHERLFLQQAMDVEFPAPIDYRPIQQICARTQFRSGLLFSCEGQHGGIGMVRNQILRCIRYAIHAGAAIVVPSMALRNPKNLADIETNTEAPLEYLLDREAFVAHLSKGCPGIRLYDHADDFPFYSQRSGEPLVLIGDQFEPDHPREGLRHPREWRHFFDEWLDQHNVEIQPESPVHIQLGQSFLDYPVRDDGENFVHEFGKILSFRHDTRALAAKALLELQRRFALPINPTKAINPGAYYGAHLRLEADAIWAWPPNEWRYSGMVEQFEEQFRNIERTGLSVIYVTSGNQTVVDLFTEGLNKWIAAKPGSETRDVTVVTKYDLLQGVDRKQLDSLTFDQQALIDFMMMFKASVFMGVAHSSFPWTIALRRHELSKYKDYANEGSDLLKDEYTTIMGMEADYPYVDPFVYGLWP